MAAPRPPITASSFMYPWDLADLGVEEGLRRYADEGFGALELTACYHPITLHNPGARGRRMTQMDLGGVFFPARSERYGRIRPRLPEEPELHRVWPRAAEIAGELGLDLNSWTVALYQPWIARAYPDTARVTPEGQRNFAGVCPSSPDVQEFLATLVEDLATQFPVRTVQLEGVTHPFFDTGWRVPRVLVDLTPWTRRLASLCFCPSCVTRARAREIDVEGLRRRVLDALHAAYDHPEPGALPDHDDHERWLAEDRDYAAFLALRDDVAVDLVLAIAERLRGARPEAALGIWGPEEFDGTRIDLERVLPVLGVLQTRQPRIAPENAARAVATARRHGLRVTAVHWCGGRIGPPWGPGFEEALAASIEAGIDQINLMNWAMLRPATARAVVPLLRRLEAAAR